MAFFLEGVGVESVKGLGGGLREVAFFLNWSDDLLFDSSLVRKSSHGMVGNCACSFFGPRFYSLF